MHPSKLLGILAATLLISMAGIAHADRIPDELALDDDIGQNESALGPGETPPPVAPSSGSSDIPIEDLPMPPPPPAPPDDGVEVPKSMPEPPPPPPKSKKKTANYECFEAEMEFTSKDAHEINMDEAHLSVNGSSKYTGTGVIMRGFVPKIKGGTTFVVKGAGTFKPEGALNAIATHQGMVGATLNKKTQEKSTTFYIHGVYHATKGVFKDVQLYTQGVLQKIHGQARGALIKGSYQDFYGITYPKVLLNTETFQPTGSGGYTENNAITIKKLDTASGDFHSQTLKAMCDEIAKERKEVPEPPDNKQLVKGALNELDKAQNDLNENPDDPNSQRANELLQKAREKFQGGTNPSK